MASIEAQIQAAASRNHELLGILAKTDYAKPALQQQNKYVSDLENACAANRRNLSRLSASLAKEQKDHEKYKDSVMKRFAYRATGQKDKFEARSEKEEREYFDAVNAEHQAKQEGEQLAMQLQEAQRVKKELGTAAAEHDSTQKNLDMLYNSIFAGLTPAFPEEDQQENHVKWAYEEYQGIERNLHLQQQVQQVLGLAQQAMGAALSNVDEALSASRFDMFGGGAMADYMERSALGQAESATREVYRLNQQAQQMSDAVIPLPPVQIAQGNMLGDVLFDSTFSDYNFHQKIKATQDDLQRAAAALQKNQASIEQRCAGVRQEMSRAWQSLEEARKQLQKVREGLFARAAGQG